MADKPISTTSDSHSATNGRSWVWLIWVAVAALLALIAWGLLNNREIKPQVGEPVPDFSLTLFEGYELDGRTNVQLSQLQGQVVVLNFWASWCITCIYEADDLERVWQTYRDDGVVVLGIAYLDEEGPSREFMTQYGMSYPNGPDLRSEITSKKFFVSQVPETFIIAPDGTLARAFYGEVSEAQLVAVIEPLLGP